MIKYLPVFLQKKEKDNHLWRRAKT